VLGVFGWVVEIQIKVKQYSEFFIVYG